MTQGALLLLVLLASGCGRADNRESIVRDYLTQKAVDESHGAIMLQTFQKTNGYDQQAQGLKLYIMEWQVEVSVQREAWKGGDAIAGYWQDFTAAPGRPDGFMAASWKRFKKGASVRLTGQSTLLKTDNGWRVEESEVKKWQVVNPGPKSPFDGVWRVAEGCSRAQGGCYLTIREEESGSFKFAEGDKAARDDAEFDARLYAVDGGLQGTFSSWNFRATHGVEFDYTVTLKLAAGDKLTYSVKPFDDKEAEATRVSD